MKQPDFLTLPADNDKIMSEFECSSRLCELCLDRIEIFLDDNVHVFLVGEDMLIFPDLPQGLFIRFLECKDLEADQLIEAHLEDRCRLALATIFIFARVRIIGT